MNESAWFALLQSAPAQIAATCNLQLSISCGILSTLQFFHDVGTKNLEAHLGSQFKRFHYILAENQSMRKTQRKKLFTPSATAEILDEVKEQERRKILTPMCSSDKTFLEAGQSDQFALL